MPPARSATAAPRRNPRTAPRPRRVITPRVRVRWDRVGRVGLLLVLGVVAVLYVQHTLTYFSTRAQANQQLAIVHKLVRANAQLRAERQALNDPATIIRDARALGMVRPGEHPYVISALAHH
jgi:cell division protein FtsB